MSHSRTIISRTIRFTLSYASVIACLLTACDEPVDDEHLEEILAEIEPADEPESKYVLKETDKEDLIVELETQAALFSAEDHPAERAMTCGWTWGYECAWCYDSGCLGWACNDGDVGGCCFDKYANCN